MNNLKNYLIQINAEDWARQVINLTKQKLQTNHGDLAKWQTAVQNLPTINNCNYSFNDVVTLTSNDVVDKLSLEQNLRAMCPWRKGPFNLFGINIDSEWCSNLKWQRIQNKINITKHKVLDVGCGNGYYLWRMLASGAQSVIGIDPNLLFYHQFLVLKKYLAHLNVWHLPLTLEDLPITDIGFDTVFSMGVLYHRTDPIGHLIRLREFLAGDGQLVLETLIIDGDENSVLVPIGRYAQMRNVWFIPSVAMLKIWLTRIGFKHIECIDVSVTTSAEQRVTSWMQFQSLKDFLHPTNCNLTIENLPAPKRAVLIAQK